MKAERNLTLPSPLWERGKGGLSAGESGAEGLVGLRHRGASLVEGGFHSDEAVGDAFIARAGGGDARALEGVRVALSLVAERVDLGRDDQGGREAGQALREGRRGVGMAAIGVRAEIVTR